MTQPKQAPAYYSLEELLSRSVQPFPDLPPEEFDALVQSIKTRGLLNKIQLTVDGYLWDGHQRCKALIALGKKRISAEHVTINDKITHANMLEAAIASNTVRRMQTAADKADRMHKLTAMGWTQKRIAKAFSVSQPAVSQLMRDHPPEGGTPEVIITENEEGRTYTRAPREPKAKAQPWQVDGIASRTVRKVRKMIAVELPTGLDEWEKATLTEELEGLQEAIGAFLEGMETM